MKKFSSILLIDDDVVTNYINQLLLNKLKIAEEINIATSGQKALDFLEKSHGDQKGYPDLILLDINMPVMDGFEFLEKFKNLDYAMKPLVVALTTSNITNDILKMKNFGIEYYLSKPLEQANIFALYKSLSSMPN